MRIPWNTMPYIASLGNCQYVGIPGDHLIYQQKMDEVAAVVETAVVEKFLKMNEGALLCY